MNATIHKQMEVINVIRATIDIIAHFRTIMSCVECFFILFFYRFSVELLKIESFLLPKISFFFDLWLGHQIFSQINFSFKTKSKLSLVNWVIVQLSNVENIRHFDKSHFQFDNWATKLRSLDLMSPIVSKNRFNLMCCFAILSFFDKNSVFSTLDFTLFSSFYFRLHFVQFFYSRRQQNVA